MPPVQMPQFGNPSYPGQLWPGYPYATPPFVDPRQAAAPQAPPANVAGTTAKVGGDVVKGLMNTSKLPGGLTNWGGGAGGTLGSIASVGGGALGAGFGLHDMIKAQTTGQNIVGGIKTGAGIGTMIMPGIGTAVGAGLGAAAGGIKALLQNKRRYHQGQKTGVDLFGQITSGASQDQIAGAQEAVNNGSWSNIKDPLTLIVMRDHFIKQGMAEPAASAKAGDFMKSMWDAEKKGPDAVKAAMPNPMARYF